MTTNNGQLADGVEGLVESANDHGIKVGGEWRNVSKFKPVDLPDRGARVRLELDSKGFIRTLQVLDQAPVSSSSTSTTRDRTITRLAVLKAAAGFVGLWGQNREDVRWWWPTNGSHGSSRKESSSHERIATPAGSPTDRLGSCSSSGAR